MAAFLFLLCVLSLLIGIPMLLNGGLIGGAVLIVTAAIFLVGAAIVNSLDKVKAALTTARPEN